MSTNSLTLTPPFPALIITPKFPFARDIHNLPFCPSMTFGDGVSFSALTLEGSREITLRMEGGFDRGAQFGSSKKCIEKSQL